MWKYLLFLFLWIATMVVIYIPVIKGSYGIDTFHQLLVGMLAAGFCGLLAFLLRRR